MKNLKLIFLFAVLFSFLSVSAAMGKCLRGNCTNGNGVYLYNDGNKYDGDWKNGKKNGTGTQVFKKKKEKYDGKWHNDKKHGKGKYTYKNGEVYDGDWVNDHRNGKGTYSYKNGDRYEGDWVDNKRSGTGIFVKNYDKLYKKYRGSYLSKVGIEKYEGQWRNDKKNGKGKYTYKNGEIYDGQWVKGYRAGKGLYVYANGDKYEGEWEKGKRTGIGRFTTKKGEIYDGGWLNGKKHGKNVHISAFGKKDVKTYIKGMVAASGCQTGNCDNGKGMFLYSNGNIYDGEWANGKKHGQGTYTTFRGKKYSGGYSYGKKHGKGIFIEPDGFEDHCVFDKGKLIESSRAKDKKELLAWDKTQEIGTIDSYNAYMKQYRSGKYFLQAKNNIKKIEQEKAKLLEQAKYTKEIQRYLTELGYSPGKIDGILAERTKRAIIAFQRESVLPVDGEVSAKLLMQLKDRMNSIYAKCVKRNTIEAYAVFIKNFPRSSYVKKAKTAAILSCKTQNSIRAYDSFIQKFPKSYFVKEAIGFQFKLYKRKNSIKGYYEFVRKFPNSAYVKQATAAAYAISKQKNTIAVYDEFIKKFPRSSLVKEAITYQYAIYKAKNTINDYNDFITKYPSSPIAKKAKSEKAKLVAKAVAKKTKKKRKVSKSKPAVVAAKKVTPPAVVPAAPAPKPKVIAKKQKPKKAVSKSKSKPTSKPKKAEKVPVKAKKSKKVVDSWAGDKIRFSEWYHFTEKDLSNFEDSKYGKNKKIEMTLLAEVAADDGKKIEITIYDAEFSNGRVSLGRTAYAKRLAKKIVKAYIGKNKVIKKSAATKIKATTISW